MSFFEAGMLVCFGFAWPVNIYNSLKTKSTQGKSVLFLGIIILGYLCGIIHKLIYSRDIVLLLYIINLMMVSIDVALYFVNRRRAANKDI